MLLITIVGLPLANGIKAKQCEECTADAIVVIQIGKRPVWLCGRHCAQLHKETGGIHDIYIIDNR